MHAIRLSDSLPAALPRRTELSSRTQRIVDDLRLVMRKNRSAARVDLQQACALLMADPADAKTRHAEILVRGMKQAIGKRPVFFRPGTPEYSFDEIWLGCLFDALSRSDHDSFTFLIKSRLPLWTQKNFAFLVHSISEKFRQI